MKKHAALSSNRHNTIIGLQSLPQFFVFYYYFYFFVMFGLPRSCYTSSFDEKRILMPLKIELESLGLLVYLRFDGLHSSPPRVNS